MAFPTEWSRTAIAHDVAGIGLSERVRAYVDLGKVPLSAAVAASAGVAGVLAGGPDVPWGLVVWAVVGTGLTAIGANALNQCWEVDRDAAMRRTAGRPLPTRRLTSNAGRAFGWIAGGAGPAVLVATTHWLAAVLAAAALVGYVWLYTPLKIRSPLCTLVGAIVGALPPLVGWVAVAGRLDAAAWTLAGVLFAWQIPHALSLAWVHRDDLGRAGFRLLPAIDADGSLTGCLCVLYTLVLLPIVPAMTLLGVTGRAYGVAAVLATGGLLALAVSFERRRTTEAARRLFIGTVVYLPLLLGLMLLDHPAMVAR